jgi:hypothetical protein
MNLYRTGEYRFSVISSMIDKHQCFDHAFLEEQYIKAAENNSIWTIRFIGLKLGTVSQGTLLRALELAKGDILKDIEALLSHKEQSDDLF